MSKFRKKPVVVEATVAETPETPIPSLAERIDVFLAAPGVSDAASDDLLRAAAAQLRQHDRIKAELREEHVPQWSTPEMEARGKDPIGCVMCWPQDGSWPCTTILTLEADDGA